MWNKDLNITTLLQTSTIEEDTLCISLSRLPLPDVEEMERIKKVVLESIIKRADYSTGVDHVAALVDAINQSTPELRPWPYSAITAISRAKGLQVIGAISEADMIKYISQADNSSAEHPVLGVKPE